MNTPKLKIVTLAVAAAIGLSACGGANDSTSTSSSSVTGVITGFGSVFVDGVEYETGSADFTLDGVPGDEAQLAVGMVVTIEGAVNADGSTGVANSVSFADEAEGVVLANNYLVDGTLDIMGQTVRIDANTSLDSKVATITSFDLIAPGNIVEVSGFSNGSGDIYATRLEVKKQTLEQGDEMEVKGVISGLDEAAQTFTIGSLTIDYSTAALDNISTLSDGLFVEVKSDNSLSGNTLVASKIELENDGKKDEKGNSGEKRKFEGIIMNINGDMLTINGQSVYLDDTTEFENGDASMLTTETKITVEAEFDANGQLIAQEIKFREEGDTEFVGNVESIDTINGTITLMGTTFNIDNTTIMKDEQEANGQTPIRYFDLGDIAAGDWVEIRAAYDETSGQWQAVKVKRDDMETDEQQQITGAVTDVSVSGQMSVAGIDVDISTITGLNISVGNIVEIEGSFNAGGFSATSVQIED